MTPPLAKLVNSYQACVPNPGAWLNATKSACERQTRSSDPSSRMVKRRIVKVRVFPSKDSLLRLVSAILVEIDEKWSGQNQPYVKWKHQNA